MGLRDHILEIDDLEYEPLEIPEWKCSVLIAALPGDERSKLLQNNTLPNGKPDLVRMYPALAIATVYDPETREPVFQLADRDRLNKKRGSALERIANVAMRLNGLLPDSFDQAVKNSETLAANDGSTLN